MESNQSQNGHDSGSGVVMRRKVKTISTKNKSDKDCLSPETVFGFWFQ